MTLLEQKRKEVELSRVQNARIEIEFRILEKEDELLRLKENLKIQVSKENELSGKILGG